MGYFASRAAPMGPVPADVVIATFFNFHPDLVRAVIPEAWSLASIDAILAARLELVDTALRRILGDDGRGESGSGRSRTARADRRRRLYARGSTAVRRPCLTRVSGRTAPGALALAVAAPRVPRRRTHRRVGGDRERRVRCNRHAPRHRRDPQAVSRHSGLVRDGVGGVAGEAARSRLARRRQRHHRRRPRRRGSGSRIGRISWRCGVGSVSATTAPSASAPWCDRCRSRSPKARSEHCEHRTAGRRLLGKAVG